MPFLTADLNSYSAGIAASIFFSERKNKP
ncbi:MAG: hypothetical protein ACI9U5_000376, partial [Colwellia sp.]